MANIIIKTHQRGQSETILRLTTEQQQIPVIKARSNTQYELINEATGMAPPKAVFRRVGNDMEISFDEINQDTDLVIQDYYSHMNQSVVGQAANNEFLNYLPVNGETNAYTNQILKPDSYNPLVITEPSSTPFWTTLGLENPWWIAAGLAPIALIASRSSKDDDTDSSNQPPVLNVIQVNGFSEKDANAKAGAVVAKYGTADADKDKVTVTLSDEIHYALDAKGNVTLTQKGADLIASGQSLPVFTLTPNDGKDSGNKATINPMANPKLTVTVSDIKDFIEDDAATVKGAIVAKYKLEGDTEGKATVALSDNVNYALDDKGNVVLTEKGAALINSGKPLPAFNLIPQLGLQAGQSTSVEAKVTLVNDAPILKVTETTVFVQTDKNIKEGNIVAKYTVTDEEGDTTTVSISDTEHYKLDGKGNVLLTQKGVDLISSGAELPPFKLTPNDSIINGKPVVVGPEINSAPVLTITKSHDFTNSDAEVKVGAIVVSFETKDVDSTEITVKLSDETHYALDGKGNVVLTEKGAALVNNKEPLPEFKLTPNDEAQDGADVTVNPNDTADSAIVETNATESAGPSMLAVNELIAELNSDANTVEMLELNGVSNHTLADIGMEDLFADSSNNLYTSHTLEANMAVDSAKQALTVTSANEASQPDNVVNLLYGISPIENTVEIEPLQAII